MRSKYHIRIQLTVLLDTETLYAYIIGIVINHSHAFRMATDTQQKSLSTFIRKAERINA